MAPKLDSVVIEDADLLFRNFAGIERELNSAGDRNFCVILKPDLARKMKTAGWNVKELKAREEGDEPKPYIQVTVEYRKGRPPRVVLITSRGRTDLGADEVGTLDWAEIKKADLILSPYEWEVRGERGVKAYLKSMFVTINEDQLELKYADLPVANANSPEDDDE